jgi:hypothetical protein
MSNYNFFKKKCIVIDAILYTSVHFSDFFDNSVDGPTYLQL